MRFIILVIISIFILSNAEAKNANVLHLGKVEVRGELRRPKVIWIDAHRKVKMLLPEIYAREFKRFEADILQRINKGSQK